ncbi:hypothetical protein CDL12_01485 [Handroanthus impetiginosus]|uniref:F-box associated beta-propeller type 3 domain-containing protein n=1 Tax=Handroanthus impetiginosus TaxID=429701 RepID=A0A2G9I7N5_9LAMI|nr:hypothetical protein CDL12_01485 [Handroanthus impetiginosus]
MAPQCYTWIFHLFKQIIGHYYDPNVIKDTLSGRRAQVRDRPLILRYFGRDYLRLSIIDGESEKKCNVRGLQALKSAKFVCCCNELVLLKSSSSSPLSACFVLNPLSEGKITTVHPPNHRPVDPCGFFFHPLAKEYRILAVRKESRTSYEYYLYLFGDKSWRRTSNPCFHCLPTYNCTSASEVNSFPAILNGGLHWYIGTNRIMVFDMINEEFCVKPLPFERCYEGRDHLMRDLLVKDDSLCFCHVGCQEGVMDIWILEDYTNWCWIKKYIVNLDWDIDKYPIKDDLPYDTTLDMLSVISIHKDELVIFWRFRGMFSYHLVFNSVEKIHLKKSEMDDYSYSRYFDYKLHDFVAYNVTKSN